MARVQKPDSKIQNPIPVSKMETGSASNNPRCHISLLSGGISMKLATNIHHASGHC